MGKFRTLINIVKNEGISHLFNIIKDRIFPVTIKHFPIIKKALKDNSGIEIGGPSWHFRDYNIIPVYKLIKNLDVCNFSTSTIWEGDIKNGQPFHFYNNKTGQQYIGEATNLSFIPDATYGFVITSHCLEHTANPLKAIEEWLRIIKKNGYILIIVPNKEVTFDHKRKTTTLAHLLDDYNKNRAEDDFTHLDEILELHDLKRDLRAGTFEQFKERSLNNFKVRALHHHVFDLALLKEIYTHFKMEILVTDIVGEDIMIFGKKTN